MTLAEAAARRRSLRAALSRLLWAIDRLPASRSLRELEGAVIRLRAHIEREDRDAMQQRKAVLN
jgi:hypothetical protein